MAQAPIVIRAFPIQDKEPSEIGAVSQNAIDRGAKRSESDTACHDDEIAFVRGVRWPTASEWSEYTDRGSRPNADHGATGCSNRSNRVDELPWVRGVATHGYRDLAHSKRPQHAELPGFITRNRFTLLSSIRNVKVSAVSRETVRTE